MFHPLGRPGADECAVLSSVPLEDHAAYRLTDLHLTKATTNRTAPIVLTAAKLHDGPWLADWHTPAHNGGLDPSTWPAHVYDAALEGLRVAVHDMGGGDGKLIAADWNVDLARGEIRDRIGKDYPHMHWSWHPGQKPTEGGRVIDGFLTNLPIKQPAVTLPLEHGFDHHAVFAELGEKRAVHRRAAGRPMGRGVAPAPSRGPVLGAPWRPVHQVRPPPLHREAPPMRTKLGMSRS
jgi:hypothetical protein